jgi:hypothetical protein
MRFQRNISLLLGNEGLLACGVHCIERAGGTELAAPVEKATVGLVEKAAVGPCAREAHDGRETRWRGRKTGCRALAWRRYRPAERRRDGEGGVVERETGWRGKLPRQRSGARSRRAFATLDEWMSR